MKNVIVVLNYNDFDTTVSFINQVKDYKILDEIIVVDNCSTDNSYKKLLKYQSKRITILKSLKNGGYGYGNNIGCKYANKKYKDVNIIISNPDIIVEEDVIKKLLSYLNKENIDLIAPLVLQDGGVERGWKLITPFKRFWSSIPFVYKRLKKQKKDNFLFYADDCFKNNKLVQVDVVTGCFFIVKGSSFKNIGYFDENIFLYGEEESVAYRLKEKKMKTFLCSSVSVIHNHSVSINKNFNKLRQIKFSNRSIYYVYKKYCNINIFDKLFLFFYSFNMYFKGYLSLILFYIKGVFRKEKK